jgi:hypothetical protein
MEILETEVRDSMETEAKSVENSSILRLNAVCDFANMFVFRVRVRMQENYRFHANNTVCYNNEIMHTTQKNRKYHIVHLLEKQP